MQKEIHWADYQHLLFDLDGTLVDSSRGVVEATNYALIKLGRGPRLPGEIMKFIGYPLDTMFSVFCDAPVDKLKAAFQEKARQTMVQSAVSIEGAADVLDYLTGKGFRLAIATTKFATHTRGLVEKFGWRKYFSALVSGDEVGRVKPAADSIFLALERLGARPETSVMIGDTVNDIMAARNAGIKVIAIRSRFGNHDLAGHNPDLLLGRISQLKEVFG